MAIKNKKILAGMCIIFAISSSDASNGESDEVVSTFKNLSVEGQLAELQLLASAMAALKRGDENTAASFLRFIATEKILTLDGYSDAYLSEKNKSNLQAFKLDYYNNLKGSDANSIDEFLQRFGSENRQSNR